MLKFKLLICKIVKQMLRYAQHDNDADADPDNVLLSSRTLSVILNAFCHPECFLSFRTLPVILNEVKDL